LYADTQADSLENEPAALAAFDEWTRHFVQHVESKGMVARPRSNREVFSEPGSAVAGRVLSDVVQRLNKFPGQGS
jgi:hypothetical protein